MPQMVVSTMMSIAIATSIDHNQKLLRQYCAMIYRAHLSHSRLLAALASPWTGHGADQRSMSGFLCPAVEWAHHLYDIEA
jgi:hypothetical protein